MKKFLLPIKYGLLAFLILLIFAVASSSRTAKADEPDLSVQLDFSSTYIYEFDGNHFLSSNATGKAAIKYILTNNTEETIRLSGIRIAETLSALSYDYGNTLYNQYIDIAPGESISLDGKLFSYSTDVNDYTFQYDVKVAYTRQDDFGIDLPFMEEHLQSVLPSDMGMLYITRENIDFDTVYESFQSKDNLFAGDTVTLVLKLTSKSNVPVRNITANDQVYGHLGDISMILPGETVEVSCDVTVKATTLSYPYITYISEDYTAASMRVDFTASKVGITVSQKDYRLGMEIQCDDIYIANNQKVNIKFIIKNLGSGDINNIVVIDYNGDTLFTIPYLTEGEIYENELSMVFSPNDTYIFKCVSPQTPEIEYELSFMSVPGLDLTYAFDKDASLYVFGENVTVTYIISNKGSVGAKNLVLSDGGKTVTVGTLASGEEKRVVLQFSLNREETVFEPKITGVFDDGSTINEIANDTVILVKVPEKTADIYFEFSVLPEIIYPGSQIEISYTLTNNGTGALTSYSVSIVNLNMIAASDGIINPGQTKSYKTYVKLDASAVLVFKISGKHGDKGEIYTSQWDIPLEVIVPDETVPTVTPTPSLTPTPSGGVVDPTQPPVQEPDEEYQLMMVLIFTVGTVSVIMLLITIGVLIKKILSKRR